MNEKLPKLTTMMLDALVGTLPKLPQNTRAAAVCRCVYSVYAATHGLRPPWEVMGKTATQCEKQVETQPVTIIDTTAEVVSEETYVREENRPRRHVAMPNARMSRQGTTQRTTNKRMRSPDNPG